VGTITVKIPLIKKSAACVECRHYGGRREEGGEKFGWCLKHNQRITMDVALGCSPRKSWKKK